MVRQKLLTNWVESRERVGCLIAHCAKGLFSGAVLRTALMLTLLSGISQWNEALGHADENPPPGAEVCQAPVWETGDIWRFLLDKKEVMVKLNEKAVKEQRMHFYTVPYAGLEIFPLWVGKKYSSTIRWRGVMSSDPTIDCRFAVTAVREVTVRAGTFKCYEISMQMANDMHKIHGSAVLYYSPETRSLVKTRGFHLLSAQMHLVPYPHPEIELVAFEPASQNRAEKEGLGEGTRETAK